MHYSILPIILTVLTSLVLGSPQFEKRRIFTGVATFNDFIKQVSAIPFRELHCANYLKKSTVCGPLRAGEHYICLEYCSPPFAHFMQTTQSTSAQLLVISALIFPLADVILL